MILTLVIKWIYYIRMYKFIYLYKIKKTQKKKQNTIQTDTQQQEIKYKNSIGLENKMLGI